MESLVIKEEVSLLKSNDLLLSLYLYSREVGIKLAKKMVELLPNSTLIDCGKKLGIANWKRLTLHNETELAILYDYCLYYHYLNDKNLVDRFIMNRALKLTDNEKTVVLAMQQANFSLLEVVKTLEHSGVLVKDLLRNNRQELLIDKGLSSSAIPGLILASTIIRFPEFIMTTGAALPINPSKYEINFLLTELKINYSIFDNVLKDDKSKFISELFKTALQECAFEFIKYKAT